MASLSDLLNNANSLINASNNATPLTGGLQSPNIPSGGGNGLPYSNINYEVPGQFQRNIISWFVPQFGLVQMFINPQNITYNEEKLIVKERTKGGFTLQYWGEELTTINIVGVTGSAGIEGLNMLHEIYRAEQYAFDAVGLTLAANNASADVAANLVNTVGGSLGQFTNSLLPPKLQTTPSNAGAAGGGILGGILGMNSPNNTLAARNITTLAELAFGVEFYYGGWVYRGYFKSMSFGEHANDFLIDYNINFVATQRRGYRTNYFPWSHTTTAGSSQYNTPYSYNGQISNNQ